MGRKVDSKRPNGTTNVNQVPKERTEKSGGTTIKQTNPRGKKG